jgi:hypothetical protein
MQLSADKFIDRGTYTSPRSLGAPTACYPNSDPETELQIANIQLDLHHSGGSTGRGLLFNIWCTECATTQHGIRRKRHNLPTRHARSERNVCNDTLPAPHPIRGSPGAKVSTVQSLRFSLRCAGSTACLRFDEMYHIEMMRCIDQDGLNRMGSALEPISCKSHTPSWAGCAAQYWAPAQIMCP